MAGSVRRLAGSILLAWLLVVPAAAQAQQDPSTVIKGFYDVLLSSMKEAKQLGFQGRYKRMEPAVKQAYDLPLMMSIASGGGWSKLTPEQKQKLTDAFTRYSIAQYAGRFDGYSGERFDVGAVSDDKGGRKIVQTKLVQSNGEPVTLNYLMQPGPDGSWKIIDVFLGGTISQLAANRAEFSGVLTREGADGLLARLNDSTKKFEQAQ